MTILEAEHLFAENLPLIDKTIGIVCRQGGMRPDQIEDFAQFAKLHMIERDYAVIRAYQERSSFGTFIGAVVMRLLLDHRNHEWGKWRPSAEAERLGELAVDVERLLYRDGQRVDEAFHVIALTHPGVTRAEVEQIASQLPVRQRRRPVGIEEAEDVAAPRSSEDVACAQIASRISEVVRMVLDRMSGDDQLILQLRFEAGMTVSQIARAMDREQQRLYTRLYAIFRTLKFELAAAGITWEDVTDVIGTDTAHLDFNLKNRGSRPSQENGSQGADR